MQCFGDDWAPAGRCTQAISGTTSRADGSAGWLTSRSQSDNVNEYSKIVLVALATVSLFSRNGKYCSMNLGLATHK